MTIRYHYGSTYLFESTHDRKRFLIVTHGAFENGDLGQVLAFLDEADAMKLSIRDDDGPMAPGCMQALLSAAEDVRWTLSADGS